jgi:hypothetical protein
MGQSSNIKIALIAISIASIGGGGYFIKNTIKSRSDTINEHINKLSSTLPPELTLKKVSHEMGLMESNGKLLLQYKNKDSKYNSNLTIDYNWEHSIQTLIGGDIDFNATLKLDGDIINTIKLKTDNGTIATAKGSLKENGDISLAKEISEFTFTSVNAKGEDTTVKTKKGKGTLEIFKESGVLTQKFNIPEITISNSTDSNNKNTLKSLDINYSTKSSNIEFGKLLLNIASFDNIKDESKIEGIKIKSSLEKKKDLYNSNTEIQVSKINSKTYKNTSLDTTIEIVDMDKNFLNIYKNIFPNYILGKTLYEKDNFTKGINNGISLSLSKFNLKNDTDKFDLSGKYKVSPIVEGKPFSLAQQSNFNLKLNTEGSLLNSLGFDGISPEQEIENKKPFSIELEYTQGILKIDKAEPEEALKLSFIDLLTQFSVSQQLEKAIIPEPIIVEPSAPQITTK